MSFRNQMENSKMKPSRPLRYLAVLCVAAVVAYLAPQQATSADSPARPLSSFDPEVKALLAQMTLEEKIGQMTQPDQEFIKDVSDIERYFVGSVLSGGGSDPRRATACRPGPISTT